MTFEEACDLSFDEIYRVNEHFNVFIVGLKHFIKDNDEDLIYDFANGLSVFNKIVQLKIEQNNDGKEYVGAYFENRLIGFLFESDFEEFHDEFSEKEIINVKVEDSMGDVLLFKEIDIYTPIALPKKNKYPLIGENDSENILNENYNEVVGANCFDLCHNISIDEETKGSIKILLQQQYIYN